MPTVSIIITCYNLGQYVDEAITSVFSQTEQDFEIIVVNDGSTDEYTNKLLSNYNKPKLTVYNIANLGAAGARNFGINKSLGQYICCLDADDILHKNYLTSCISTLENDSTNKLGFVSTWVQQFENDNNIWQTEEYNPVKLLLYNLVHVSSVFKKKCWEEVGGYANNMSGYEDWCFWIAIVSKGWQWEIIKQPYFFYRIRSNSKVSISNKNKEQLISNIVANNYDYYCSQVSRIVLIHSEIINNNYNNNINLKKKYARKFRNKQIKLAIVFIIIIIIYSLLRYTVF